jgi:hypothetical protein
MASEPDEKMAAIEATAEQIAALAMPLMRQYGGYWAAGRALEKAMAQLKRTCTSSGWPSA